MSRFTGRTQKKVIKSENWRENPVEAENKLKAAGPGMEPMAFVSQGSYNSHPQTQ